MVYTILAINFIIPTLIYIFAPDYAVARFAALGTAFGVPYTHTEDSVLWRVLAIANVATLGFVCVFAQVDIRKHWPALYPLWFLKSMAVLGFLVAYAIEPFPGYLGAALLDGVTVTLMVVFARGALRETR